MSRDSDLSQPRRRDRKGERPAYVEEFVELKRLCESGEPRIVLEAFRGLAAAAQYRHLYDATLQLVPAGARVLDWGCGDGHFSHFLLARGYRVDSFTLQDEPPLFDRLPEAWRARHAFMRGSPGESTRLPYADAAFDAVFSVGVLEHVRETGGSEEASLDEIHRILRPSGLLLCFHLPNRRSWIECASRRAFRDAADDENRRYHLYRYDRNGVETLLGVAAFRIVIARRYGMLPRNMMGRLPRRVRDSERFVRLVDASDAVLEKLLGAIAQNHGIVALRD